MKWTSWQSVMFVYTCDCKQFQLVRATIAEPQDPAVLQGKVTEHSTKFHLYSLLPKIHLNANIPFLFSVFQDTFSYRFLYQNSAGVSCLPDNTQIFRLH